MGIGNLHCSPSPLDSRLRWNDEYKRAAIYRFLEPVEGVFGFGGWVVFGAGPSFVSELVEFFEDEGVVDFASSGFVASGCVCELDMSDSRQEFSECLGLDVLP